MLVSSAVAGSLAEFVRHAGGSIPEPLGLATFGMTMFIVSTGIRRRESFLKSPASIGEIPFEKVKVESVSPAALRPLPVNGAEIPKQLASL